MTLLEMAYHEGPVLVEEFVHEFPNGTIYNFERREFASKLEMFQYIDSLGLSQFKANDLAYGVMAHAEKVPVKPKGYTFAA